MKKLVMYSLLVALLSAMVAGCGGDTTNDNNVTHDPNAPTKTELDPTTLKPEFD